MPTTTSTPIPVQPDPNSRPLHLYEKVAAAVPVGVFLVFMGIHMLIDLINPHH